MRLATSRSCSGSTPSSYRLFNFLRKVSSAIARFRASSTSFSARRVAFRSVLLDAGEERGGEGSDCVCGACFS
jgi:hypothetical protein